MGEMTDVEVGTRIRLLRDLYNGRRRDTELTVVEVGRNYLLCRGEDGDKRQGTDLVTNGYAEVIAPAPSAGPVAGIWPPKRDEVWRWDRGGDWLFTGDAREDGQLQARRTDDGPCVVTYVDPSRERWTFVRYGTPPAVEAPRVVVGHLDADSLPGKDGDPVATWTDHSGNGHHFVAPKPAPTRDTYASLRAKLLREEGVRICPCGEPATTHSGKCEACSWGRPSVVRRPTIDGVLRLPAKPEPWVCPVSDEDLLEDA